jgi:transcriptional regulator with GAF, ATPase, and Fis domain
MSNENYLELNLKLESIIELVHILDQQTSFEEILRIISVKAIQLFETDSAKVMMLNPETEQTIKTIYKEQKDGFTQDYHLLNVNLAGWVQKDKKSLISADLNEDERFSSDLFKDIEVQSAICVALKVGNRSIGTLHLLNKRGNKIFTQEDLELAEKFSFVIAPFLNMVEKIEKYFTCSLPDDDLLNKYSKVGLIGKGKRFIDLLKSIEAASKCNVRVLLEGATGTGKEMIARAIHKFGERNTENFSVLDCGTIPESLIESEIFGYVKGAFTGAIKDRMGIIEEADNGTLFIDEVCNLPLDMQSKFLRFLQEKEFRVIGANEVKKIDVRIIAASSVPLLKLVKEKKFREELYYRLNVYPIQVPSLDERAEDITSLVNHFIPIFAQEQKKSLETFDDSLMEFLTNRHWAGNIRELENLVERLVALSPSTQKIIGIDILPKEYIEEMEQEKFRHYIMQSKLSLTARLNEIESQIIREALINHEWNQTKAAQSLNIPEQTLRYRMHKLKISKE